MNWEEAIQNSTNKTATRAYEDESGNDIFMFCFQNGEIISVVDGFIIKQDESIKDKFTDWKPSLQNDRKEVKIMPRKDGSGPPSGSKGPRDGRGGGKGAATGRGTGLKTGGRRGTCK